MKRDTSRLLVATLRTGSMVAIALFEDSFAPMASPALAHDGFDPGAFDPGAAPMIDFTWTHPSPFNPSWEKWFRAAGLAWTERPGMLRFSEEGHAIEAALSGQGVALLSLTLLADDLRVGRLVRLPGPAIAGHTYHLVHSAGRALAPHVAAAHAWLCAEALACKHAK